MSDTCNAARKAKRLLALLVAKEVETNLGQDEWSRMSEAEKENATRTHCCDCWQHLRNIFLAEMSSKQAAHVQEELKPELETFSAWERMSTNFDQLLRASFKEFHHSCRYYKGHRGEAILCGCGTRIQRASAYISSAPMAVDRYASMQRLGVSA